MLKKFTFYVTLLHKVEEPAETFENDEGNFLKTLTSVKKQQYLILRRTFLQKLCHERRGKIAGQIETCSSTDKKLMNKRGMSKLKPCSMSQPFVELRGEHYSRALLSRSSFIKRRSREIG